MTRLGIAFISTGFMLAFFPVSGTPAFAQTRACVTEVGIGNAYAAIERARGRRAKRRAESDWRKRVNANPITRGRRFNISGRTSMNCTAIVGSPTGMTCRFWAVACE